MKHVFTATSRHLTTTAPHSIRRFSAQTRLNRSSHLEELSRRAANLHSPDEAQEGEKTTGVPSKEEELVHEEKRSGKKRRKNPSWFAESHGHFPSLPYVSPQNIPQRQPNPMASKHDRPPHAEGPLSHLSKIKAPKRDRPPTSHSEIYTVPYSIKVHDPPPGSLGEPRRRMLPRNTRFGPRHTTLNTPASTLIGYSERDSLTRFQSVIANAVAPSSELGWPRRVRNDQPEEAKQSKQSIPRPLRRLSSESQKILRSELGVIATKLEHGARVRRWELNMYLKHMEAGVPQYWDAQNRERDRTPHDDKNRGGNQSSRWWREVAMVQRFEAALVQLEQLHRIAPEISPFSRALLKRLKKAKTHNFYFTVPVNDFSTLDERAQHQKGISGKDTPASSKATSGSMAEEEQKGKEEERKEVGATEQTGSTLDLSYSLGRSPSMYSKRAEGVFEPDSIQNILIDVKAPSEQLPIAQLEHNLERVLFNPGVHWLQDPRARVYNYPPYLKEIPSVHDFSFNQIESFRPPSLDPDIPFLMREHNKKFSGSTSSLSGMMCHLYFLISGDKRVNTTIFSKYFNEARGNFTAGQRMPTSVMFKWQKDETEEGIGRYYIDGGGGNDSDKNILTWMGMMLEKFLTMPKHKFDGFLRSNTSLPSPDRSGKRDAFRFTKTNKFIMRSQLDCHDPRLPGSGVFDIKTRACMPIRIDLFNFEENSGYLIRTQHGKYESFEREYYDLVRSAFLKYQFQVRIGGMDGVIVAYHNTEQMFGFQYISVDEMDARLFGPSPGIGDRMFKACVRLLENVAEEVAACFPEQNVRATFETLEHSGVMTVFVEPVNTASDSERVMKLLEVETLSCLDNELVKPWEGFVDMEKNWSVRWNILRSSKSPKQVRQMYYAAKHRQFRAWAMPTGVDPDDLQEWYENLNFGNEKEQEVSSTFKPEKFRPQPDPIVLRLRQMAREGRRDTERMTMEEMNRPKYVLD